MGGAVFVDNEFHRTLKIKLYLLERRQINVHQQIHRFTKIRWEYITVHTKK